MRKFKILSWVLIVCGLGLEEADSRARGPGVDLSLTGEVRRDALHWAVSRGEVRTECCGSAQMGVEQDSGQDPLAEASAPALLGLAGDPGWAVREGTH